MMKPWIKKIWVEALRSGKYQKAREELVDVDNTGFCCLGVLTDLYAKEHGLEFTYHTEHLKEEGRNEMLSSAVMRWAGLTESAPMVKLTPHCTICLPELNDDGYYDSEAEESTYYDFDMIADVIERSDL